MKLHKSLLLFGASVLLLTACGDDGGSTEGETDTEEPESEEIVEDVEASEEETEDVEEEAEEAQNEIILGEPMEIGDYILTVTSYELGVDYEDNDVLIINYDWENNSDEEASPFMTFMFKGFQSGVETDDVFMVDGVDLGIGQKEIKAGGKIEDAQDIVGIESMDEPLLLEVDELITFESNPYTVELNLSELE